MSDTHTHNPDGSHHHPPHGHDHPARPTYFRMGEVVLLVSHATSFNDWNGWLNALNELPELRGRSLQFIADEEGVEHPPKLPHEPEPYKSGDLDVLSDMPISFSAKQVQGIDHPFVRRSSSFRASQKDLTQTVIYTRFSDPVDPKRWLANDTNLVELVNKLNARANSSVLTTTLLAAAPNWLFCGATHGFGDGGPGGWPVSATEGDVKNKRYMFPVKKFDRLIRRRFGLPQKKEKIEDIENQKQVNVVILDTAPIDAYLTFQENELLNSLRHKLKVVYAHDLDIRLPPDPYQAEHHYIHKDEYDMSDHGIFIAGIIHSIAPHANIYLVEVLNRYGVCTMDGLTRAIEALTNGEILFRSEMRQPLVVNCSLCISFPPTLEREKEIETGETLRWFELHLYDEDVKTMKAVQLLHPELTMLPFRIALDRLQQRYPGQIRIIAAAGNDGRSEDDEETPPNYTPPTARYPAAFPCIVGVGALEKNRTRAWYSNKADAPPYTGLMVFGGKSKFFRRNSSGGKPPKRWNQTLGKQGMLGIYLGTFPTLPNAVEGTPDPIDRPQVQSKKGASLKIAKGWAWWSGTSFATGVVTGIFALVARKGYDIRCEAENDIVTRLKSEADGTSREGESMLDSEQGEAEIETLPTTPSTSVIE